MVQEDMCSFISQSETEEIVPHVLHSDLSITQNFIDGGALRATLHGVPENWIRQSTSKHILRKPSQDPLINQSDLINKSMPPFHYGTQHSAL